MPYDKSSVKHVVGVDLGGTHVSAGLVTFSGQLIDLHEEPIKVEAGAAHILGQIAELILTLMAKNNISHKEVIGVGVGSPGPLDRKSGVIIETYNLKWFNVPLVDTLKDLLKMEVILNNDAISATYGEWWAGVGKGTRHLVGLTLGTGIGGGMVLDGHVFYGYSDMAGHFGHMIIEANGRACTCGNIGCLEAYASATAIVGRTLERQEDLRRSLVWKEINGDVTKLTSKIIYDCAVKGDPLANDIFEETGRYLGAGVVNVIHTINPEMIVIAGAVASAGRLLFEPLGREVEKRAFKSALKHTSIVGAKLGEKAGVIGAAGLAKNELQHQI